MQAILVTADADERDILTFVLRHAGLAVSASIDLEQVTATWLERPADLIVVAGETGKGLAKDIAALRGATEVPLILLLDDVGESTHVALVRTGVDLVLMRPVSPLLLAAYAQSVLRRAGAAAAFAVPTLDLHEIALDPTTRSVRLADAVPRRLTQLEFRLLYLLMTHRGQVLPTDLIVERVWGYSGEGDRDLVRGLISRLRKKIEADPDSPVYIQTVPGIGYLFALDHD
ncbi:MAG: response regulator transcription factor [Anaerolineales bacterium]|jgi:DNA-binding response OmpR family regulator|nr:response regulator transcription factor [Anaerolineales bacterium]